MPGSAQIVFPVLPRRRKGATFGEMRLRLMRDFQDFALGDHPIASARRAIELTDQDNLWPAYAAGWQAPFGQFLCDIAPLLDDPMTVIGRYTAAIQQTNQEHK